MPATKPLPPTHEMRAASWAYPPDITPADAARAARRFARARVNTVLTEGNRYLMYDPPPGTVAPEFHFVTTPRPAAERATRIVADAMHDAGIRVIHHITSCYVTSDLMEQHRDWTQRDARRPDEPLFFGDYGGVWLFCPNNPDFRARFIDTLVAFARSTGVDGWMIDEVEFLPDWFSCGCAHCRALFRSETGRDLPSDPDSPVWGNFEDATWRAWIAWRMGGPARFFAELRARLDAEVPGQILTSCHAGVADTWSAQYWGIDEVALSEHLNLVFYEAYVGDAVPFHAWPRFVAELEAYSACARRSPHPPLTLFYPRSPAEAAFCWALAASRGHRLWSFVPMRGVRGHTLLGSGTVSPGFGWQSDHEQLFRPAAPLAGIAVLFSKPSRDLVSPMDNSYYIDEWAGWVTAFVEARVPFRVVLNRDLTTVGLDGVALLVMPNAVCLSDEDMDAVKRFRASGGRVVATADTALRGATGALRDDAVRGEFVRELDLHLPDAPGRLALRRHAKHGQPMPAPPDPAAVSRILETVRGFGGSIPWRVETEASVSVNVMRRGDGSLAVHLLNTTGALAKPGDPLDEVPEEPTIGSGPARDVEVTIELPAPPAGPPKFHAFGSADPGPCPTTWDGRQLTIRIPEVASYAVVEIPAP